MKISPKFIFGSAGLLGVLAIMTDSNIQAKVSLILPSFLSPSRVLNAEITCSRTPQDSLKLTPEESEYRDLVWEEAMVYLKNIAIAAGISLTLHCSAILIIRFSK